MLNSKYIKNIKIFLFIIVLTIFVISFKHDPTFAQTSNPCQSQGGSIAYKLASGNSELGPDSSDCFNIAKGKTADFLQNTFNLAVGISISIAVVLLILNGVMGILKQFGVDSPKVSEKYNSEWYNPIVGLIIIFCSVVVVRTLNPDLLEFKIFDAMDLTPKKQNVSPGGAIAR